MSWQRIPVSWINIEEFVRRIAHGVNQLGDGRSNGFGSVTLTENVASTAVTDRRVGTDSVISFMATTANAAAEIGAGGMYVSARGNGTFTSTHANNAQTDRTFAYSLQG